MEFFKFVLVVEGVFMLLRDIVSCVIMGWGECITAKQLECAFDKAISKSKEAIKVLLLNSFGSILDENEISKDCFKLLLKKILNNLFLIKNRHIVPIYFI